MMKVPQGMTEGEAVDVIDKVVNALARKFRFGYHAIEDMKQQGRLFAVEVLTHGNYDESRPLENFLFTHVRNRLINYKRDNYVRNEPPCRSCPFFDPKCKQSTNQCSAFEDKTECKKLMDWKLRNDAKKSLMQPVDVSIMGDTPGRSQDMASLASFKELEHLIDKHLSVELRSDYLRMKADEAIPKSRRQRVREAILAIIQASEREDEDEEGPAF